MTASELLHQLGERGAKVTVDGDELVITAPHGTVDNEIKAALSREKVGLLALLTGRTRRPTGYAITPRRCPECGRTTFRIESTAEAAAWVCDNCWPEPCEVPEVTTEELWVQRAAAFDVLQRSGCRQFLRDGMVLVVLPADQDILRVAAKVLFGPGVRIAVSGEVRFREAGSKP